MLDAIEKYKVVIQDPATEMLVQHTRFLAQISEPAAKRLIKEFRTKAKTLETMPQRCPWLYVPGLPEHKYRKLIFEKSYMLVFQIVGNKVFVDAMADCRQDLSRLLREIK
jgi:plasmid stabilization system protein ParE